MTANFLFVSDDKYVKNLGVCTYSLLHNTCPYADSVRIFVMDCGITEQSKAKLEAQTKRFDNAEIIFYDVNAHLDSVMPKVPTGWHRAIYGRLFLDEILKLYGDIERILYFDSDIIINQPIMELFELDLQGKCIAGVADGDEVPRKRELGLSVTDRYINSGVLVIDTKRWVELDASKKIIEYINNAPQKLIYPDQDAINVILKDEILIIPLQYNFFWMICDRDIDKILGKLEILHTKEEIHYALHNIKVLHFAGHNMWFMHGITPIPQRIFVKYKNLSDWKNCRRSFQSVGKFFLYIIIGVKRKIYGD